jgi:murein DD-endopeptidase MepM/ murein hydrolase activator NlpD
VHSLARTFQKATPKHADVVSAVYARTFVWDLDLRRDLQKGDQVSVVYEWDGELAHIPVASYRSSKLGRTLEAYRFQATGDAFPSWWDGEGREMSRVLLETPLRDYEQITSLLKDRPGHRGMDFKTPVGTDVISPKAGTVVRTDWNLTYNGKCAEVRFSDGTLARFLHLSRTDVRSGQRLAAGEVIGLSGSTGRSTAPHLHYELERKGKVVDPVDYHGVMQRALPAVDLAAFNAEKDRLQAMLDTADDG